MGLFSPFKTKKYTYENNRLFEHCIRGFIAGNAVCSAGTGPQQSD